MPSTSPAANPVPSYFGIEITRRCNLQCPHCFTDSGPQALAGPDGPTVRRLLAELAAAGVKHVAFSGGEPLLRRDLEELMRHGREHGIVAYGIVTNGALAEPARVKSLVAAGLDTVQVSLDGVTAEDHGAVRGCGPHYFYRAVRAIRLFRDAGARVDVACLLTARNVARQAEMTLFCEALGVRGLRYCTFVPTGRGAGADQQEEHALDPAAIDEFLAFLRTMNAAPDAPLKLFIDHGIGPWSESGAFRCPSGRDVAYMSAEGDLYPCPGLVFPPFRVGNVFEQPVAELLTSPAMATVRRLAKPSLAEPCASCANTSCTGGCRGRAFAETGDIRGPVSYCNVCRR